jgi:hypothetical protein
MNEHSPLSRLDELPIHQIPLPLHVVETSDVRASARRVTKYAVFHHMTGGGVTTNRSSRLAGTVSRANLIESEVALERASGAEAAALVADIHAWQAVDASRQTLLTAPW